MDKGSREIEQNAVDHPEDHIPAAVIFVGHNWRNLSMTEPVSSKRLTVFPTRIYIDLMAKLLEYEAESRLSSLSLLSKIALVLAATIGVMFCGSPMGIVAVAAAAGVILLLSGVKPGFFANYFFRLSPIFLIVFLIHLFCHQGDTLFKIAGLKASFAGAEAGLLNVFRLIDFMLIAILLFRHVSAVEIGRSVVRFAQRLRFKPLEDLAIAFFVAVRFIPLLAVEIADVKTALQLRGAEFSGGLLAKIKFNLKILIPLLVRVIRQSYDVGTALALKSYRNCYFPAATLGLSGKDLILLPLAVTLALVLIRL